jgi:hypothetical protein
MAAATFNVRQFFNIPFITSSQSLTSFTAPTGVFVVTGSESRVLINDSRTNLANDSFSMNAELGGLSTTLPFSSSTSNGWWPGPPTIAYNPSPEEGYLSYGIIVGGNQNFTNTSPDSRTSFVSCWGWITQATQGANETAFIALAKVVIGSGALITNLATAKGALRDAGYYYQFPAGFDGQSPNTGAGSD